MDWTDVLSEIKKKDKELDFVRRENDKNDCVLLKYKQGNVLKVEKQRSGFKIIINANYIKMVDKEKAEQEKIRIANRFNLENRPQKGEWWKTVDSIDKKEIAELTDEMKRFAKQKIEKGRFNVKIGRGLEDSLVEKFKDSEWLIFFKKHEKDGLMLGIRNNYVNIYYKCSSLVKIDLVTKSATIAKRFLNEKNGTGYIQITSQDLEKNYADIKNNIDKIQTKKIEKVAQQKLIINNNSNPESEWFCVDLEYVLQLPKKKSEYGRFDIIAITKKEPYRLALIELKATSGAIGGISEKFRKFLEINKNGLGTELLKNEGSLSAVGSLGSGVLGHAYDYVNYLKTGFYKSVLKREVIDIIKNYQTLNIIDKNAFADISEDKITEQPEIFFLTINNKNDAHRKTMYNYLCSKNFNASKYNLEKIFGVNITEENSYFNPIFLFTEGNEESIHDILELSQYEIGFKKL